VIDDRIVLDNSVMFDSERARVRTKGRIILSAVVDMWKKHPEWERLEIEGHSDARGPERFNQWLSEERAKRVRNTMVGLGVPESKLSAQGFGSKKPRAKGKSDEVFSRNRRVELVVIRRKQVPQEVNAGAARPSAPPAGPVQPPPAGVEPGSVQPPDINREPVYGRPQGSR
jgi:hypothetical protein